MHYGIWSLLPPILTLIIALTSKNIMVALFCGIVSCSVIVNGLGFFPAICDTYLKGGVSGNLDMFIYMIVFGAFIAAIKKAGGFAAFAEFADRKFNTGKKAKFLAWLLSALCVNQSIGTIGVGSIMRPITDRHRVSREKLGFILSTTAEPVTALVPITIYILFFGGLITELIPGANGAAEYVRSIPFNFFCILSIIAALLYALELLPDFGYMKKCEERARTTGQVYREGSQPMETRELDEMTAPEGVKPDILCFAIPFAAFFASIIYYYIRTGGFVLTSPSLIGLLVALAYPMIRGYIKFRDIGEIIFSGAKSMTGLLVILARAIAFGSAVGEVGFANYVVEMTQSLLTPAVLPAVVFLICCVGSYATGSLVSACVILAPLALGLASSIGADFTLIIAALVGGSTFGDSSSPLSDIVVESAMGASVDVVDLGKAQFAYKTILALITAALYLVLGLVMM